MSELVKESDHIAILHQAGIARSRLGKIAHQDGFRHLLATNAIKHRRHFRMAIFSRPRMHVEIKPSDSLSAVEHFPGFNTWVPRGNVFFALEFHMEQS